MVVLLTLLHVAVCLLLILVVLLQTGKRADLAGAFGGGGSQTAFGARGAATVLSKATTIAAVIFMLTSFALSLLSTPHSGGSTALDEVPTPASSAPAEPGAPTAPAESAPQPASPTPPEGE